MSVWVCAQTEQGLPRLVHPLAQYRLREHGRPHAAQRGCRAAAMLSRSDGRKSAATWR